jgi:hypothetical protein
LSLGLNNVINGVGDLKMSMDCKGLTKS